MSNSIKEALGDHVYSKVSEITSTNIDKLTGMLLECDKNTIFQLLENKKMLISYVKTAQESLLRLSSDEKSAAEVVENNENTSSSKETLSEDLYNKIFTIVDNELMTAQITGMLLDLDLVSLNNIMMSEKELNVAVEKAKVVLLENKSNDMTPQDKIADEIYTRVEEKYPQVAPQITGMLLELGQENLEQLLKTDQDLDCHIKEAFVVLSSSQ